MLSIAASARPRRLGGPDSASAVPPAASRIEMRSMGRPISLNASRTEAAERSPSRTNRVAASSRAETWIVPLNSNQSSAWAAASSSRISPKSPASRTPSTRPLTSGLSRIRVPASRDSSRTKSASRWVTT